jgi:hypothetical protein
LKPVALGVKWGSMRGRYANAELLLSAAPEIAAGMAG